MTELEQEIDGLIKKGGDWKSQFRSEEIEKGEWKSKYNSEKDRADNLQLEINTHICRPCPLVHLDHTCPPCNLEHCSHSDYEKLKEHVCPKVCSEEYHQTIRLEQEKEVIQKINTDCQLGCAMDSNLGQVINKIKELIATPGGASLTVIIQLEKETMKDLLSANLFTTYKEKLEQVGNYSELVAQRKEIIKAQLAENQQVATVSPAEKGLINGKNILIGGLIITLLAVGGMLTMRSRKNKQNSLPVRNGSGKSGSVALPTLQQINRYLAENNIKSLEIDEQGGLVTRFK